MDINALVVDDSKYVLAIIKTFLQQLDIKHIDCYHSSVEALETISNNPHRYNLIFVDLQMPVIDGVDLINRLAKQHYRGGLAIISGMDTRVIRLAAETAIKRNLHLVGGVSKPLTLEKLKTIITKFKLLFQNELSDDQPMSLEELLSSMDKNLLVPYFQPKINLMNGNIQGFETVARITIPGRGDSISPNQFIPVAEHHACIDRLSYQLLNLSLQQFGKIREIIHQPCKLAINLSPLMLNDEKTPETLLAIVQRNGLQPENIIVEITEQMGLSTTTQLETLNRLCLKGFGLSLDDFGTGFTNIQQLKELPFTEIKIDRSLIYNIANDSLSQVIVKSIMDISRELELDVIAEGVENADDLAYLRDEHRSAILQGYFISQPKPFESMYRWCHCWNKVSKTMKPVAHRFQ